MCETASVIRDSRSINDGDKHSCVLVFNEGVRVSGSIIDGDSVVSGVIVCVLGEPEICI